MTDQHTERQQIDLAHLESTGLDFSEAGSLSERLRDVIGGHLRTLMDASGTPEAEQTAIAAWEDVQLLQSVTAQLASLTTAAVAVAKTLRAQRDEVIEEHEILKLAIKHEDEFNPLISRLIDNIRDEAFFKMEEVATEEVWTDLADSAAENTGIDYKTIRRLVETLMGERDQAEITETEWNILYDFLMESLVIANPAGDE